MKRTNEASTQSDPEETESKKLKSGPAREMSYVRFVNHTTRKVDIIWINFEGQGVKYKTVEPRRHFDVTTFVGHPWVFRDCETGDKLVVQLKSVYNPQPLLGDDGGGASSPRRRVVYITIPVYSLRERSMQVVRSVFSRSLITKLDIPRSLISELLRQQTDQVAA